MAPTQSFSVIEDSALEFVSSSRAGEKKLLKLASDFSLSSLWRKSKKDKEIRNDGTMDDSFHGMHNNEPDDRGGLLHEWRDDHGLVYPTSWTAQNNSERDAPDEKREDRKGKMLKLDWFPVKLSTFNKELSKEPSKPGGKAKDDEGKTYSNEIVCAATPSPKQAPTEEQPSKQRSDIDIERQEVINMELSGDLGCCLVSGPSKSFTRQCAQWNNQLKYLIPTEASNLVDSSKESKSIASSNKIDGKSPLVKESKLAEVKKGETQPEDSKMISLTDRRSLYLLQICHSSSPHSSSDEIALSEGSLKSPEIFFLGKENGTEKPDHVASQPFPPKTKLESNTTPKSLSFAERMAVFAAIPGTSQLVSRDGGGTQGQSMLSERPFAEHHESLSNKNSTLLLPKQQLPDISTCNSNESSASSSSKKSVPTIYIEVKPKSSLQSSTEFVSELKGNFLSKLGTTVKVLGSQAMQGKRSIVTSASDKGSDASQEKRSTGTSAANESSDAPQEKRSTGDSPADESNDALPEKGSTRPAVADKSSDNRQEKRLIGASVTEKCSDAPQDFAFSQSKAADHSNLDQPSSSVASGVDKAVDRAGSMVEGQISEKQYSSLADRKSLYQSVVRNSLSPAKSKLLDESPITTLDFTSSPSKNDTMSNATTPKEILSNISEGRGGQTKQSSSNSTTAVGHAECLQKVSVAERKNFFQTKIGASIKNEVAVTKDDTHLVPKKTSDEPQTSLSNDYPLTRSRSLTTMTRESKEVQEENVSVLSLAERKKMFQNNNSQPGKWPTRTDNTKSATKVSEPSEDTKFEEKRCNNNSKILKNEDTTEDKVMATSALPLSERRSLYEAICNHSQNSTPKEGARAAEAYTTENEDNKRKKCAVKADAVVSKYQAVSESIAQDSKRKDLQHSSYEENVPFNERVTEPSTWKGTLHSKNNVVEEISMVKEYISLISDSDTPLGGSERLSHPPPVEAIYIDNDNNFADAISPRFPEDSSFAFMKPCLDDSSIPQEYLQDSFNYGFGAMHFQSQVLKFQQRRSNSESKLESFPAVSYGATASRRSLDASLQLADAIGLQQRNCSRNAPTSLVIAQKEKALGLSSSNYISDAVSRVKEPAIPNQEQEFTRSQSYDERRRVFESTANVSSPSKSNGLQVIPSSKTIQSTWRSQDSTSALRNTYGKKEEAPSNIEGKKASELDGGFSRERPVNVDPNFKDEKKDQLAEGEQRNLAAKPPKRKWMPKEESVLNHSEIKRTLADRDSEGNGDGSERPAPVDSILDVDMNVTAAREFRPTLPFHERRSVFEANADSSKPPDVVCAKDSSKCLDSDSKGVPCQAETLDSSKRGSSSTQNTSLRERRSINHPKSQVASSNEDDICKDDSFQPSRVSVEEVALQTMTLRERRSYFQHQTRDKSSKEQPIKHDNTGHSVETSQSLPIKQGSEELIPQSKSFRERCSIFQPEGKDVSSNEEFGHHHDPRQTTVSRSFSQQKQATEAVETPIISLRERRSFFQAQTQNESSKVEQLEQDDASQSIVSKSTGQSKGVNEDATTQALSLRERRSFFQPKYPSDAATESRADHGEAQPSDECRKERHPSQSKAEMMTQAISLREKRSHFQSQPQNESLKEAPKSNLDAHNYRLNNGAPIPRHANEEVTTQNMSLRERRPFFQTESLKGSTTETPLCLDEAPLSNDFRKETQPNQTTEELVQQSSSLRERLSFFEPQVPLLPSRKTLLDIHGGSEFKGLSKSVADEVTVQSVTLQTSSVRERISSIVPKTSSASAEVPVTEAQPNQTAEEQVQQSSSLRERLSFFEPQVPLLSSRKMPLDIREGSESKVSSRSTANEVTVQCVTLQTSSIRERSSSVVPKTSSAATEVPVNDKCCTLTDTHSQDRIKQEQMNNFAPQSSFQERLSVFQKHQEHESADYSCPSQEEVSTTTDSFAGSGAATENFNSHDRKLNFKSKPIRWQAHPSEGPNSIVEPVKPIGQSQEPKQNRKNPADPTKTPSSRLQPPLIQTKSNDDKVHEESTTTTAGGPANAQCHNKGPQPLSIREMRSSFLPKVNCGGATNEAALDTFQNDDRSVSTASCKESLNNKSEKSASVKRMTFLERRSAFQQNTKNGPIRDSDAHEKVLDLIDSSMDIQVSQQDSIETSSLSIRERRSFFMPRGSEGRDKQSNSNICKQEAEAKFTHDDPIKPIKLSQRDGSQIKSDGETGPHIRQGGQGVAIAFKDSRRDTPSPQVELPEIGCMSLRERRSFFQPKGSEGPDQPTKSRGGEKESESNETKTDSCKSIKFGERQAPQIKANGKQVEQTKTAISLQENPSNAVMSLGPAEKIQTIEKRVPLKKSSSWSVRARVVAGERELLSTSDPNETDSSRDTNQSSKNMISFHQRLSIYQKNTGGRQATETGSKICQDALHAPVMSRQETQERAENTAASSKAMASIENQTATRQNIFTLPVDARSDQESFAQTVAMVAADQAKRGLESNRTLSLSERRSFFLPKTLGQSIGVQAPAVCHDKPMKRNNENSRSSSYITAKHSQAVLLREDKSMVSSIANNESFAMPQKPPILGAKSISTFRRSLSTTNLVSLTGNKNDSDTSCNVGTIVKKLNEIDSYNESGATQLESFSSSSDDPADGDQQIHVRKLPLANPPVEKSTKTSQAISNSKKGFVSSKPASPKSKTPYLRIF